MTAGLIGALVAISVVFSAGSARAGRNVDVAFILDAPLELVAVDKMIRDELSVLLANDYAVRFPESGRFVVNGDRAAAKSAVDKVMADASIEVVVGLGSISAMELSSRGPLPKPSFGALTFDPQLLGLPRVGEASGVRNLNYVTSPVDISELLGVIGQMTKARKIGLLVPGGALAADSSAYERLGELERRTGIDFEVISLSGALPSVVAKVPGDVDALIAVPLLRYSEQEVSALAAAFVSRKLPAFSFLGSREVELGFLASSSPDSEFVRIARRVALNVQRALGGENPGDFPVTLTASPQITINAATAVRIDALPPFDLLVRARLLNREALRAGDTLTLEQAMLESVGVNLDLKAEDRVVAAGRSDVLLAIAKLLPQARGAYLATIIDQDRAKEGNGRSPERSQVARVELEQILFDEKLLADVSINKHVLAATEAFRDQVRLDVIQGTGVAFLEVTRAQASQRIQEENERVTRENLKLAETRRKVGTAAAGEVYRWRSQLAQDERSTIFAFRDVRQAEMSLNRILDRKTESLVNLDPHMFGAVTYMFSDERVSAALRTPHGFEALRAWFAEDAIKYAPELRQLAAQVAAQERFLASTEREFWSPKLSVNGRLDGIIDEDGAGTTPPRNDDDQEWRVGFEASIPLFEGGRRVFQTRQARDVLSELRIREDAERKRVDEAVRRAAFQAWSSFMAIDLSRAAAEAAARNLDLVTKSYSRGTVSVVDLLDAQNAATTSADEAENAVFDHLIDVLDLQRAIGRFWMFESEEDRRGELEAIRARVAR